MITHCLNLQTYIVHHPHLITFMKKGKILTLKTINQNIINTKYAVRGELAIRADQITKVRT